MTKTVGHPIFVGSSPPLHSVTFSYHDHTIVSKYHSTPFFVNPPQFLFSGPWHRFCWGFFLLFFLFVVFLFFFLAVLVANCEFLSNYRSLKSFFFLNRLSTVLLKQVKSLLWLFISVIPASGTVRLVFTTLKVLSFAVVQFSFSAPFRSPLHCTSSQLSLSYWINTVARNLWIAANICIYLSWQIFFNNDLFHRSKKLFTCTQDVIDR